MLTRREERLVRALARRRHREAEGLFVAEGVRALEDLVASPLAVRFAVVASPREDGARDAALLAALARRGVPVRETDSRTLVGLSDTETPQGVLAVAEIPRHGLDAVALDAVPAVALALDAVQDPGNFGTLVRTAEALGAAGVVALPGTVDAWNPKAVRAAMGSSFRVPVVQASWDEAGPWARAAGAAVLAAAAGGAPLGDAPPARALLVLGNEGAGISEETRGWMDREVGIPLRGRAESLNVAAAGAILLHALLRS